MDKINELFGPLRESTQPITVAPLRKLTYAEGSKIQDSLVNNRKSDPDFPDNLLFFEFDSVYTAGTSTKPEHIPNKNLPVLPVNRGGSVTWHGPGQLVAYLPIKVQPPLDIKKLVFRIEAAIIDTLKTFNISGERVPGRRGVWVKNKLHGDYNKIAAMGLRTSENVVSHGLGLNCNPDLQEFSYIVPCGIDDAGVTSITQEIQQEVTINKVYPLLAKNLVSRLDGE